MKKLKTLITFVFLTSLIAAYNNCGGNKVQFTQVPSSAALNSPISPPGGDLTFNTLNEPATIAYNDNYPNAGDSDFNDFVVNLNVIETYNSLGALTKITVQYTPKYKYSSADHQFVLVFDGTVRGRNGFKSNVIGFTSPSMYIGEANIDYELTTAGQTITSDPHHDKSTDLILFPSTSKAMSAKQVATVTITGFESANNTYALRGALAINRYRTVLNNGSADIDISDINPAFVDLQSHAPCGFFVPVNWRAPVEGHSIYTPYPLFAAHAIYLQSGAAISLEPASTGQWFNAIDANYISSLLN